MRFAVLASGNGSNLQALIDRAHGHHGNQLVAVASDKSDARALLRAREAGIACEVFARAAYGDDRVARDEAMAAWLTGRGDELVVLAGYLQIVTPEFLRAFPQAVINVHPALLPAFPGLRRRPGRRSTTASRSSVSPSTSSIEGSRYRPDHPAAGAAIYPTPTTADEVLESAASRSSTSCWWRPCMRISRRSGELRSGQPRARVPLIEPIEIAPYGNHGRRGSGQSWPPRPTPSDRRVRRALLSVSDKTGHRRVRPRASSDLGDRDHLHRRHRQSQLSAAGDPGPVDHRSDRLSGDHGRPRQDAASEALRRPAGGPRQPRARACRPTSTTSNSSTSIVREPVPVRAHRPRNPACSDGEVIENIDIGGPTMIRAAAKNFVYAAPVVSPESYDAVLNELRETGGHLSRDHPGVAGRGGVRLHRPLRHRDRPLVPGAATKSSRPLFVRAYREACWSSATARTPISAAPTTSRSARRTHVLSHGLAARAASRSDVQQPARSRCRPAA